MIGGGYSNLSNISGVRLIYVKKVTGNFIIDSLLYLFLHSREIDILNLYHMRSSSALQAIVFKIRNTKGRIYLKCDGGGVKENYDVVHRWLIKGLLKRCDLVSTEMADRSEELSESWEKTFLHINNPFHPAWISDFAPFADRKSQIVTVGRLGTTPKNTEMLMEGFLRSRVFEQGWKLVLIGPMEKEQDFEQWVKDWFNEHPEMFSFIEFKGEINDRETIMGLLKESKIFALPSRHENFSLALVEAASQGNYIIGTDIQCIRAITNDFNFGSSCHNEDADDLADVLSKCCNKKNENELEQRAIKQYEYCMSRHSLKEVADKICLGLDN